MKASKAALLAEALLMGLSACGGSDPVIGYRDYTDAELQAFYTDKPPATLPTQSSSLLGENYTLSGKVPDWNKSKAINLYYSPTTVTPPNTADGQISADGQLSIAKPLLSLASAETTLKEVITPKTYSGTCPIDSLTASKEVKVKVLAPRLTYYVKDVAALGTQTSPPSIYGRLEPAKILGAETVFLVWANEFFTLQGEKRCLSGSVQTDAPFTKFLQQDDTLDLLRKCWVKMSGWNTSA